MNIRPYLAFSGGFVLAAFLGGISEKRIMNKTDEQFKALLSIVDSNQEQLSAFDDLSTRQQNLLESCSESYTQSEGTAVVLAQTISELLKVNSLLKGIVDLKDETIAAQEEIIAGFEASLHHSFPAFVYLQGSPLSVENLESLRSSFREDSPPVIDSSCYVNRMYVMENPSESILLLGNCVFVTPDLVLSNYHVFGNREISYIDEAATRITTSVRTDTGFQSFVLRPIAVSPLYDLALVQVEHSNPDFRAFGISQAVEEKGIGYSYFYTDSVDVKERLGSLFSQSGDLEYLNSYDSYGYTLEGSHTYPSFHVTPPLERGYSGSPVFQDGKLVGLVSSTNFKESFTTVTPHVKSFLEQVIEEKNE